MYCDDDFTYSITHTHLLRVRTNVKKSVERLAALPRILKVRRWTGEQCLLRISSNLTNVNQWNKSALVGNWIIVIICQYDVQPRRWIPANALQVSYCRPSDGRLWTFTGVGECLLRNSIDRCCFFFFRITVMYPIYESSVTTIFNALIRILCRNGKAVGSKRQLGFVSFLLSALSEPVWRRFFGIRVRRRCRPHRLWWSPIRRWWTIIFASFSDSLDSNHRHFVCEPCLSPIPSVHSDPDRYVRFSRLHRLRSATVDDQQNRWKFRYCAPRAKVYEYQRVSHFLRRLIQLQHAVWTAHLEWYDRVSWRGIARYANTADL